MASLALILLALAGLAALATAVLSRWVYDPAARPLAGLPPERRANLLLGWALAPLAAGVLVIGGVLGPSLLAAGGLMADHCRVHGDHHHHLCLLHPGATPGIPGSGLLVALLAAGLGAWVLSLGIRRARTAGPWRTLRRMAGEEPSAGCRILDTGRPVAVTAGLLRPVVLLSRGLLDTLTPDQTAAVTAHEAAHRRRGDPLRLALARLGCRLHLPGTGRALERDLALAVERAADEAAARGVGDRVTVAEALVAVARLRARADGAIGFGSDPVELRVQALLAGSSAPYRPWRGVGTVLAAAGAALAAWSPALHHGLETLLGHL